jgi:hypothetical protein
VIDADDGYHHCGPEIAVPTLYRMHRGRERGETQPEPERCCYPAQAI